MYVDIPGHVMWPSVRSCFSGGGDSGDGGFFGASVNQRKKSWVYRVVVRVHVGRKVSIRRKKGKAGCQEETR